MLPARVQDGLRRLLALAVIVCSSHRGSATDPALPERTIVDLYRQAAPAVVRVIVATEDLDENGKPRTTRLALSGFFISRDGRVLTNSTAKATRIWVEKDGISNLAASLGSDERTNIGLLQVNKLPEQFGVITLPASDDTLEIGTAILAVTGPLEFDPTPSPGLITGYESSFSDYPPFPVTYMRINIPGPQGSVGSPILDMHGSLVGITLASLPQVNSTYALPVRAIARVVEDLLANQRVIYGALPIEFIETADKQNISRQIVVASIVPDSTAARAGIRPGDIVRKLGAARVSRMNNVRDALFYARVGKFLAVEIEREGKRLEFQLQVEPRAEPPPTTGTPATTSTPPPAAPQSLPIPAPAVPAPPKIGGG